MEPRESGDRLTGLIEKALANIEAWWSGISIELNNLVSLWVFVQLALIAAAWGIARLVSRLATPPLETALRKIENQPGLMRVLVVFLRRLDWIFFTLALWTIVVVMRDATWPSRSYLVWIAASLAGAWVIISIVSRFIRNPHVANLVAVSAWTVAALNIFGILGPILSGLDKIGFAAGDSRISLLHVLQAGLLLMLFLWAGSLFGDFMERRLRSGSDFTETQRVLVTKVLKAMLVVAAVLAALATAGIDITALAVFSGALGLGIGIGLQKLVSNLLSGVIILLDRSIKPGDVISLGDTFGWINSLRARFVSVVTRDGVEYLIPNENFVTERVVNWSHSDRAVRLEIKFGVSYDADPHEVRKLATEAAGGVSRVQKQPAPVCHLTGFGDSALEFVLRFWIQDPEGGVTNVRGQVFLALWDALKAAKIEIPYPHRQIVASKPLMVEVRGNK
ncbi:MAG: mechanosensitive ion channel domain-containing protein [Pseudomonadota bacterium]|nr:mechanosensitive ion channel domain-containing protein [Pseudomonadota bacterium]